MAVIKLLKTFEKYIYYISQEKLENGQNVIFRLKMAKNETFEKIDTIIYLKR